MNLLVDNALDGFDLHVIALVLSGEKPAADTIHGLAIFNSESNAFKTNNGTSSLKVVLQHISSVNLNHRAKLFDKTMDFIWKHTHCSAVRLNLYHIKDAATGQYHADPDIKVFLKERKFKWKTVKNDMETGLRSEILEV